MSEIRERKGGYYRVIQSQGAGKEFFAWLGRTRPEAEAELERVQAQEKRARAEQRQALPEADRRRLWKRIGEFRADDVRACLAKNRVAFFTDAPENFTAQGRTNPTTRLFDACRIGFQTIGTEEVLAGGLDAFDVLFCPGGFGYLPPKPLAQRLTAFVRGGGGFLGFCAGAFLPLSKYLKLVDAGFDYLRETGIAMVHLDARDPVATGVESTAQEPVYALYNRPAKARGHRVHIRMFRGNGPLLKARGRTRVVGYFDSNRPYAAILRGRYGTGRVLVFSVHPDVNMALLRERTSEENVVQNARLFTNAVLHCARRR